jgi:hypothetical protein
MINFPYEQGGLRFAGLAAVVALTASVAFSQAVSQISGVAHDMSGAVVAGAEITATALDTGVKRSTSTDESGNYTLPNLPPGPYRLEAAHTGFRTYVQTGIALQVDSNPVIPVVLGVGDVTQIVEVEANATLVETQKLGVGTVMENQRILELPLNGRTPTDLIALTGAAVQTGGSPIWSMNTGVTISVAGGQNYGVYYGLDGAPNINLYDSTNMPLPFPDALQEFKVETSTQNAQTGTHSGAQINAVTRSGSNSFHGDAFEFLRNGDLNARNFFAASRDTLKRNQFGGTVGGPILKNKLFFFAGYQGTTIRQTPISTTAFIPTALMDAGDFTTYASAACQGRPINLGGPFVNNKIAASQMSPAALKIAATLPKTSDPCGRFLTGNLVSQFLWQAPARIDYQLSEKHSIFGRWLGTKINTVAPYTLSPKNILTTTGGSTDDLSQSLTLGDTYLFSGTRVNAFRASLGRVGADHEASDFFGPTDLGINAYSNLPHEMLLTVPGAFSLGASLFAHEPIAFTFLEGNDDFSWIHGSHQFAIGGNFAHSLVDITANVRSIGNYTVNGQTTGLALADFLAGDLSQMRQSATNGIIVAQYLSGLYAQDTWKLKPRLTLTYGLRWEPFTPMQVKDGKVYTFSLARYNAGITSTIYHGAPAGFYYPGDPGFNGKSGMNSHYANFEPRAGLAWDPFGDGKTSIRVGAGISYDFVNEQIYANENNVAPFSGDTTVNGPVPLDNPWQGFPGGNPFPYTRSYTNPTYTVGAVYMPIPPDLNTPEIYTWNLTLQRQFSSSLFVSASYVGTHAIHLWDAIELNPGVFIPGSSTTGNLNSRRLLNLADPVKAKYISNLTAFDDGATSNYNGMILSTAWRAVRGVSINANYTWSHCIGDQNWGGSIPNPGQNYVHLNNRALDRGNCSFATASSDRRNLFNLTVVAQTPRLSNHALRLVASGWTASAIYRFSSGAPLTILSGLDQALIGFSQQRANQVLPNPVSATQGSGCANVAPCISWLNASAFQQPALGTLGNLGTYNVLGPGFFQFDMALVRQFGIRERHRVEFRAEAFNVTNSLRANNPGTTLSTPSSFGNILSAQDPRIMQMAMKYTF